MQSSFGCIALTVNDGGRSELCAQAFDELQSASAMSLIFHTSEVDALSQTLHRRYTWEGSSELSCNNARSKSFAASLRRHLEYAGVKHRAIWLRLPQGARKGENFPTKGQPMRTRARKGQWDVIIVAIWTFRPREIVNGRCNRARRKGRGELIRRGNYSTS